MPPKFEFLNRVVHIPGSEWDPPEEGVVEGVIKKYNSRNNKIEIAVRKERGRYIFPFETFPREWIQEETYTSPRVSTRSRSRLAEAESATAQDYDVTPQTLKTKRRSAVEQQDEQSPVNNRFAFNNNMPITPETAATPRMSTLKSNLKKTPSRTPSGRRLSVTWQDEIHATQATKIPKITSTRNFMNAVLGIAAILPALAIGYWVAHVNPATQLDTAARVQDWPSRQDLLDVSYWQALMYHRPMVAVNVIFFLNVDVLFWLLALAQSSTWLIDPAWTVVPVLIGLFYEYHPAAHFDVTRSMLVNTLLRIWSVRLTHSYFRREEWQFGAREDWRFTTLAKKFGSHWWWISFFATYVSQHLMLVGITLPLYAVHSSTQPISVLDIMATMGAVTGLFIAFEADNQLRAFTIDNQRRRDEGRPVQLILDSGIWRYSRHPNYFGEQLWWWGLGLFAVNMGQPWMLVGAAFNSLCMVEVTRMVEKRMLDRPERAAMYKEYQQSTSVWVPWFKFGTPAYKSD